MVEKKKVKEKPCKPKYDKKLLDVDEDGKPVLPEWPPNLGPNPCCPGSKPLPDDGPYNDKWREFRDRYCPLMNADPKPDPDPPFGTGGTMSNYEIPDVIGGDRSMQELERQRLREEELERIRREHPELIRDADGNYPDLSSGPFGVGNWKV